MLTTDFFTRNRSTLCDLVEDNCLVVLTANGLMQRNNDSSFAFRQDSSFYYLTGLDEENITLVLDTTTHEEFLILPRQTEVEKLFGGTINCDNVAKKSGIQQMYNQKEGWSKFVEMQKSRKKIYTLAAPPVQLTRQERMFSSPARRLLIQKLKRLSKLPHAYIGEQLADMRSIKKDQEVALLKQAIEITKCGLVAVRKQLPSLQYEYQAEAILDYEFKVRGARHGFLPPIVAAGANATIVHYQRNSAQIKKNDLLLMDIGAEVQNYGADISRVYKVSGKPTARENDILQAIASVSHHALDMLKPGLSWREYILSVDEKMGDELLRLKLITHNSRDEVRRFFPYSISHSLGLDTHDICDYTKPMQEGMVITVEPGIHIAGEGIGVRIEDDVLITKDGARNLSADVPY